MANAGGGTEVYGVGVCESRVRSEKKREKTYSTIIQAAAPRVSSEPVDS